MDHVGSALPGQVTPRYGRPTNEGRSDSRAEADDHRTLNMSIRRLVVPVVAAVLVTAGLFAPSGAPTRAAVALPPLPAGWPSTRVEIGLADAPGGAAALHASSGFGFRYQYLAGGVNTGTGWATWNTNAQFVSYYVAESVASGMTPVFSYYQLLQSNPSAGADEKARDLSNLANHTTMAAYFADLRLFFARAAGSTPVVLQVEPDLWGYIEQGAAVTDSAGSVPAAVASSGDAALSDLPNTAAGFAQAVVRLRNQLAPNVILGYHLSVWGTNHDISYANDPDPLVDAYAARAAAFYRSLGASFDVTFTDIADRDAAFKTAIYGDGGASWWDDADFVRYARFVAGYVGATAQRVVVWQIPLGNTRMRAMNDTWGHYQDNRVQWFLDDPSGTHLALWRDAGVIALMFGGGAGGTTCACDAQGDGTTNPAAINGNSGVSVSADDDGGYFRTQVVAYYASGGLSTGAGVAPPPRPPLPPPGATIWSAKAAVSPASVARRHSVTLTVRVRPTRTIRARVEVDVYDSAGHRVYRHLYVLTRYKANVTRVLRPQVYLSAARAVGTYTVKVRILAASGGLLGSNTHAATFKVHR